MYWTQYVNKVCFSLHSSHVTLIGVELLLAKTLVFPPGFRELFTAAGGGATSLGVSGVAGSDTVPAALVGDTSPLSVLGRASVK